MSNLDNPRNIIGMGDLLADDGEDLDIDDLEKSITTGVSHNKKTSTIDLAKEYGKEIDDLGRKFGFKGQQQKLPSTAFLKESDTSNDTRGIDELLNWSPGKVTLSKPLPGPSTQPSKPSTNQYKTPYNLVDDSDESDSENDEKTIPKNEWSANNPQDDQLNRMTTEERKQDHVNKVLGSMEKSNDDAEFVQKEDEEDEMARIMEQIDLLRTNLESEGQDLGRIPDVNTGTSKKEAKAVLRILQIKNDTNEYI